MIDSSQHREGRMAKSSTDKESGVLWKYLILPIIASVVVSLIVTNLNSLPSIQASAAHDFLDSYFGEVTHAAKRQALYQNDLTSNFRAYPGVDWPSYNAFWRKWNSVSVNSVTSVPGNSLEFAVTLTYQPKHGGAFEDNLSFWLVCTGITGNILAHIPDSGCPSSDVKIDNEQLAGAHQ
jgi:hypothetical protein